MPQPGKKLPALYATLKIWVEIRDTYVAKNVLNGDFTSDSALKYWVYLCNVVAGLEDEIEELQSRREAR